MHRWRLPIALFAAFALAAACADDRPDREDRVEGGDGLALDLEGPFNEHGVAYLDDGRNRLGITLDDYYFAPTYVEMLPSVLGNELDVTLLNEGDEQHTFTVEELGVDEVLDPGTERTIRMTIENVIPAVYQCRFHADRGMRGALTYQAQGTGS